MPIGEDPFRTDDYGQYFALANQHAVTNGLDSYTAEDVAQTVVMKIFATGGIPRADIDGEKVYKPTGYIATAARSVEIDVYRSNHRHQARVQRVIDHYENTLGIDPADVVAANEVDPTLMKAVNDLPTHMRDVILLCAQELGYVEIAERLQVAVGTVRSRLFRAREILARELDNRGNL